MNGYMNSGIRVSYPRSKYDRLNNTIKDKIGKIIFDYMNQAAVSYLDNFTYTLDISYEDYSYQNIESFVFFVSSSTGGAHPDNTIFTINYDSSIDKIITIDDLVRKNNNILTVLSRESYNILSKNKNITDKQMLMEGLKPTTENFSNIVFTPIGIKIYFPQYQVAPYSVGSFQVLINYKNI